MIFHDRIDAGQRLAKALIDYKDKPNTVVLALPRGGVPVAFEISHALNLPLDLMLVRKLGVPRHEEFAMGAIANGNVQVLDEDIVRRLAIPQSVIADIIAKEHAELERRNKAYRQGKPAPMLEGKKVILVDDGCATGANMKAAVLAASKQRPERVIVAVPIATHEAYEMLHSIADEVVCLDIPEQFYGVGGSYRDFSQTSDNEVKTLLKKARYYQEINGNNKEKLNHA